MENFEILEYSQTYNMEGTLRVALNVFLHLYTVNSFQLTADYHWYTASLKPKTKNHTEKFFDFIQKKIRAFPLYIVIFFIQLTKIFYWLYFFESNIRAYHFHFAQVIWRKLQKYKLDNRYKNDSCVKDFILNIVSFVYVPPGKIPEFFGIILNEKYVLSFLGYFQKTFIIMKI